MNNVFVLYDRSAESLWYPTDDAHLEATSGPQRGTKIEFLDKPEPMTLESWRKAHPETTVLLPPED